MDAPAKICVMPRAIERELAVHDLADQPPRLSRWFKERNRIVHGVHWFDGERAEVWRWLRSGRALAGAIEGAALLEDPACWATTWPS